MNGFTFGWGLFALGFVCGMLFIMGLATLSVSIEDARLRKRAKEARELERLTGDVPPNDD